MPNQNAPGGLRDLREKATKHETDIAQLATETQQNAQAVQNIQTGGEGLNIPDLTLIFDNQLI